MMNDELKQRPSSFIIQHSSFSSVETKIGGHRPGPFVIYHLAFIIHHCHVASLARTFSLTRLPSALLPASLAIVAFITLPMSLAPHPPGLAPAVSAIAAATAASICSTSPMLR